MEGNPNIAVIFPDTEGGKALNRYCRFGNH